MNPVISEQYQFVSGVDTHASTHTFAVLTAATGAVLHTRTFPTLSPGLGRTLGWIARRIEAASALIVVEGTCSYGAIVTVRLELADYRVVEGAAMPAGDRRGIGKRPSGRGEDGPGRPWDVATTNYALPERIPSEAIPPAVPGSHCGGLLVARDQMTAERSNAINVLTALLRTVDLGIDARKSLTAAQLSTNAAWREREENLARRTCRAEATRLARRIKTLTTDLATNRAGTSDLIADTAPELLALTGIGPVVAAPVIIAWSHPGRVRSEAAMAPLAGPRPIPASSGNTVCYGLNRGGDRHLNRSLTTIVIVRMRIDPATRQGP